MKFIAIIFLAFLLWVFYLFSGTLDKQDKIAKSSAASVMNICLKARQSRAHCACIAEVMYKMKTPQGTFDRTTLGLFWSKQEAIKKYGPEREQCKLIR